MGYKIFINGEFVETTEAKIPVQDAGFLFGYGLFETMRSYGKLIYKLEEHIKRLTFSARFFKIPLPFQPVEIPELVKRTLELNNLKDAYIKIILSGGTYSGKLSTPATKPTLIIQTLPFTPYPENWYRKGIKATVCSIRRYPSSPIYAHKTLNFLENVLAKKEAEEKDFQEALFLNTAGYLTEGSISNLFLARKGKIITPSLSSGILPGITRKVVLNLCSKVGIPFSEREVKLEELFEADEAFLTNSLREIIPLTQVDSYIIKKGEVGQITKDLVRAYKKDIDRQRSN